MINELLGRITQLERDKKYLLLEIEELAKRLFGKRSEKLDDSQLELLFEAMRDAGMPLQTLEAVEEHTTAHNRRRSKPPGRHALPSSLPRERVEVELPEAERTCSSCGSELTRIREEVSQQLEYVPAVFKILERVRGVYACCTCEDTIVRSPKPPAQPIEKGLPGPGLLAQVCVSKYADHAPLARQQRMLARHGVELSRSTLCGWVADCAEIVAPVVDFMHREVLASRIVQTDDTPVTVLDAQSGTHKGRLWAYLGDAEHPYVVFDYSPTHEGKWPLQFLNGFRGYLQADAYNGYDAVFAEGKVTEVGCWAHARRYFHKAATAAGDSRALVAMGLIRELFAIEARVRERPPPERHETRQKATRPVLDALRDWIEAAQPHALPKSPLGEAIGYARRQWAALERFLEDPQLAADNNASERALRTVAIGRKNWLFAGSDAGGERAARLYTLIASARRVDVEPFGYLRHVFTTLAATPSTAIGELSPLAYARGLSRAA